MDIVILIVYVAAGYWVINRVWYSKHTYITNDVSAFYVKKLAAAIFFGWVAIPIAIIMTILGGK